MQNSGKTITTHASLLPQGFPIFLHFNHVWVQGHYALSKAINKPDGALPSGFLLFTLHIWRIHAV